MNINYTGRRGELPPGQQRKLDVRFAKLSKLVERKGDSSKDAHVVITNERHLIKAEITANFHGHSLIGIGSGTDLFAAMSEALEKAEKQALKVRAKWRDTTRAPKDKGEETVAVPEVVAAKAPAKKVKQPSPEPVETEDSGIRINRINHHDRRKPMTAEEAMIAMGSRDYMVYRDSDKDCVSVLIRRKDGSFDLVES